MYTWALFFNFLAAYWESIIATIGAIAAITYVLNKKKLLMIYSDEDK